MTQDFLASTSTPGRSPLNATKNIDELSNCLVKKLNEKHRCYLHMYVYADLCNVTVTKMAFHLRCNLLNNPRDDFHMSHCSHLPRDVCTTYAYAADP